MLVEQALRGRARQPEPPLAEVLADPIVRALMSADGVGEIEFLRMMLAYNRRMKAAGQDGPRRTRVRIDNKERLQ